jgi:hypothetical protein
LSNNGNFFSAIVLKVSDIGKYTNISNIALAIMKTLSRAHKAFALILSFHSVMRGFEKTAHLYSCTIRMGEGVGAGGRNDPNNVCTCE